MALLSLSETAGSVPDIVSRMKSVLPQGWFADSTPVLDGVLAGIASAWSALFGQLSYAQQQSRIATASDIFLDLAAQDFFGASLSRAAGEPDDSLRARIERGLLPPRATRPALIAAVQALTFRTPLIFEPRRIQDTGAYATAATLAYGLAGGYGGGASPFQIFVHAYRPVGVGVADTNGYGGGIGGYGLGRAQYTTPYMAASTIRDADLSSAIAATMPLATTAWLAISD